MKVEPLNESCSSNDKDISNNVNVPREFIYVKPASKRPFIIYYLYLNYTVELQKVILLYHLIADQKHDLSSKMKDLAHIVNVLAQNQLQPEGILVL